ncbi:hypothetical protein FOPG_06765 [Fusarium oxysporum f. sp. conglutinans race 2 54008]|uniref:Uncharacterized protein n=1 Tax=Fusarium oxysporum f. sp. conglutinans race 2 54008 TaxID=1089457 RepID=X0HRW5_FUSOX|nr:hypothetical protein FOPG_06765 [Fusarium oxysporum f. sp. conglutinans race 2 54008]
MIQYHESNLSPLNKGYLRRNLVEVTIFWRAAEEDLAPKLNENEELKLKLEAAESAAINQQASKSTEQHRV